MTMKEDAIGGDTLLRYSRRGPRYTSYPAATMFQESFGPDEYLRFLNDETRARAPLSLYFHIPFCSSVCWFCACSVVYTGNHSRSEPYLDLLAREMDLLNPGGKSDRPVKSMHLGGGSPTFLSPDEMRKLHRLTSERFSIASDAENGIELDPRTTSDEHVDALKEIGFNRASIGVQDVNPEVQKAIHRVQPLEMVERLTRRLRDRGFHGINFDLIYGLPHQTVLGFNETLDAVLNLRPDRISLFHFAYLPELKKHQHHIHPQDLPDARTRLEIMNLAVNRLNDAGYIHIGMDHFALPEDALATALRDGTLERNFQGYTIGDDADLLGIGVTSIGKVSGAFAQNYRSLKRYEAAIADGRLPIERGYILTEDDWIRGRVIKDLICRFELDIPTLENDLSIRFADYFRDQIPMLAPLADDGLLEFSGDTIRVTPRGKFVIRNICMIFDAHLDSADTEQTRYSRTL